MVSTFIYITLTTMQRTLDYLFHELLPRGGFEETQAFVRDRSRAVRNDFTIQQDRGPVAIECHERCARFHILSLHVMSSVSGFDGTLETQQFMNCMSIFVQDNHLFIFISVIVSEGVLR